MNVSILIVGLLILLVACTSLQQSPQEDIPVQNQPSQQTAPSNQITGNVVQEQQEKAEPKFKVEAPPSGPVVAKTEASTAKQQVLPDLIKRSDKGVTLSLHNVSYEIRGEDYAVINSLLITVQNTGSEDLDMKFLVYMWDENDDLSERGFLRDEFSLDSYSLAAGKSETKLATVKVPVNDIGELKTLKIIAAEDWSYRPRAYVSVEYPLNLSAG